MRRNRVRTEDNANRVSSVQRHPAMFRLLLSLFRQAKIVSAASRDRHASMKRKNGRALRLEPLENRSLLAAVPTSTFIETKLISDQAGVAEVQDAQLVNAWGLAVAPGGNFW